MRLIIDRTPRTSKTEKGFTLIELMIVIVVVGILFFVAIPTYQQYVLKSNRSVARGKLLDVVARMEQYFSNNRIYIEDLGELGYGSVDGDGDVGVASNSNLVAPTSADAVYEIEATVIAGPPATFSISAIPKNVQVKDTECGTFTISSDGDRSAAGSNCWKR